jgi:hypothetical protein
MYRDAYLLHKHLGDIERMNSFVDKYNGARSVCMGPRCAFKVCVVLLLVGVTSTDMQPLPGG